MNAMTKSRDGWRFLLTNCLFSMARGGYFVALAWIAIELSGSIASSGQIFATHHLTVILVSRHVGRQVDLSNRATSLQVGLSLFGVSMLAFAGCLKWFPNWGMIAAFGFTASSAVAVVAVNSTLDCLQQTVFRGSDQRIVSSLIGGARQVALMVGAGGAGIVLAFFGDVATISIMAVCLLTASLMKVHTDGPTVGNVQSEQEAATFGGVLSVLKSNDIGHLALITAVSFSVGQITNALLASFVMFDLNMGSVYFGFVDAAWSIGGILFAIAIYKIMQSEYFLSPYPFLIGMGMSLILISSSKNLIIIGLLHAVLGASFVGAKVICDGRIIAFTPNQILGKVRSSIEGLISITGLLAYLTPTFAQIESTRTLYLVWGLFTVLSPLPILILKKNNR